MPVQRKMLVERRVGKKLTVARIKEQLQGCIDKALSGNRGRGWHATLPPRITDPVIDGKEKVYTVTITFATTSNHKSLEEKFDRANDSICERFAKAGAAGPLRKAPWRVIDPKGYSHIATKAVQEEEAAQIRKTKAEEDKTLGVINLEPNGHYDRLYNREPQKNRILAALRLGQRTDWVKRTHTCLDGPPGCGKTELMLATRNMLGKENEAWRWFDATSMTKAGVLEELIESPIVPPVLFIEEIEKCDESSLRWLLGVMDTRGEIRRTNYRVGNQAKNVRMCVIASANDVNLLQRVMSGALYSRFQNKVYCPRPARDVMGQILLREIGEIGGDKAWIEPTLEFGYDKWGITDPRDLVAIMSLGAEKLLTEEYQADYEATMHPSEKKRLQREKQKREEDEDYAYDDDDAEEPDGKLPPPKHRRKAG